MSLEFLESAYLRIKERLTSPFYGTFLISWLIINYPITIALFWGNDSYKDRVSYIKEYIWENSHFFDRSFFGFGNKLLLFPLLSTFFILFGLFWISTGTLLATDYFQKFAKTWRFKILKETPPSPEEFQRLAEENASLKTKIYQNTVEYENRITAIQNKFNQITPEIKNPTSNKLMEESNEKGTDLSSEHHGLSKNTKNASAVVSWGYEYGDVKQKDKLKEALEVAATGTHYNYLSDNIKVLLNAYDLYTLDTNGGVKLNDKGKFFLRKSLE